jgi:hypothetical protein
MTEFWPAQQHDLATVQTNRGYKIAHVNLFPLQYSPMTGVIRTTTKMQLTIQFADADSKYRTRPTKQLKKQLQRNIDNPDTIDSYDTMAPAESSGLEATTSSSLDGMGPYKYIVITSNTLAGYTGANSFHDLCDSKIARGITAGIVTTEWILANYDGTRPDGGTDDQTKIRNFLIDAYQTWGTEYALLGGSDDIIPARYFDNPQKGDPTILVPADIYYGCVDPDTCTFDNNANGLYAENEWDIGSTDGPIDLTGDIAIGRAGVENSTDIANFVNKTLTYETTTDPYLDHALTSGAYLGFAGAQEYSKPFCELVRLGSDLYLGHHTAGFESMNVPNARHFNMATLYDMDYTWPQSDMYDILNGTGGNTTPQMIYCGDHGSPTHGMGKLSRDNLVANLTNSGRPFFFYDDSCDVGHFDYELTDGTPEKCFSEFITTMEHGAFACITNSRGGWGADQDDLDSVTTHVTREFFHSVLGEGILEMGRAHAEAKASSLWRGCYYDAYQSTLFGDPELKFRVTNDEIPPCDTTCGDIDGSGGNANMADFAKLASCWSVDPTTDTSCICANLVEFDKHIIDLLDLQVLAELFLSSSTDYPPYNCSASITDPFAPTPETMGFSSPPAADGNRSISMIAARTVDSSGVEYFFDCTVGGGNDSSWQECRVYRDTGLDHATEYTYTVTARDKSLAQNETFASASASAITDFENIVLPANGGVFETVLSSYSEYSSSYGPRLLTNGTTDEVGWCSGDDPLQPPIPPAPQEFVYSFRGGKNASLNEVVIHGGIAEGAYYCKNFEVQVSTNGTAYTQVASGTLVNSPKYSRLIDLDGITAADSVKYIKLKITSGYNSGYWELAEFVVNGDIID